jgi:hypothetical protein
LRAFGVDDAVELTPTWGGNGVSVRWRLSVLAIQLVLLGAATYIVTGQPYSGETWFLAGLLVVVVNPQLLEPYYSRPGDVIANSLIFFFLFLTSKRSIIYPGWIALTVIVSVLFVTGVVALVGGAGRPEGRFVPIARAARHVSRAGSARFIYSGVFLLSLLEFDSTFSQDFWILAVAWAVATGLGIINWQSVFMIAVGQASSAKAEGMIGPSSILVSAPDVPQPGSLVTVSSGHEKVEGVVINRIRRPLDVWGRIHISEGNLCERVLVGQTLTLCPSSADPADHKRVVGTVDSGSTDRQLRFFATAPLEVGSVVSVPLPGTKDRVVYQLSSAHVERLDVKGGSHLIVAAHASQLGIYDPDTMWFRSYRWVAAPGQPVYLGASLPDHVMDSTCDERLLLGHVIGTRIPVFLDTRSACDGHIAVLGMTKMGKSTLAERIARHLAKDRRVTVLDQTGEYVHKKGFPTCDMVVDWTEPGISVFEPKPGEVPAKRALDFLQYLVKQAVKEYRDGVPVQRSVIIDEAHQFVPEPAALGFGAPGRDQSYEIGLLMMQIRKYGISVMLISQRTAVVAKSALSQCENLVAFRSVDQTGLDYLEAVAGSDVRGVLPQLKQGEALVFGPAISSDSPIGIVVSKDDTGGAAQLSPERGQGGNQRTPPNPRIA